MTNASRKPTYEPLRKFGLGLPDHSFERGLGTRPPNFLTPPGARPESDESLSFVDGLAAKRAPLRASLDDAKRLISRRLLIGVLLTLVTLLVAGVVATATHNLWIIFWIAAPGLFTVGALYYADTMRLVFLPHFQLNVKRILQLLGLFLILLGLVILCELSLAAAISRVHLAPQLLKTLQYAVLYVLTIGCLLWRQHSR